MPENENLSVPNSCCKTITPACGRRDHPSNIYRKVRLCRYNTAIWNDNDHDSDDDDDHHHHHHHHHWCLTSTKLKMFSLIKVNGFSYLFVVLFQWSLLFCRLTWSSRFGSIQGCVRLGNLELGLKIQISDLQSNAKSENGFHRWNICFWISF